MADQNFDRDDVTAMRRQGDLSSFIRQGIRGGQSRQRAALKGAVRAPGMVAPGHIPGAWPAGVNALRDPHSSSLQGAICSCPGCVSYADRRAKTA
jgi:hypothetical protein